MILRVAVVEADDNVLRIAPTDAFDFGTDFFLIAFCVGGVLGIQRRDVFHVAGVEIDSVDVKVFVAFVVHGIKDVLVGVSPKVAFDGAIFFVRDGLGGVGIVERANPNIEDAFAFVVFHGGKVGEAFGVVAHAGHGFVGVAEQHLARNKRCFVERSGLALGG